MYKGKFDQKTKQSTVSVYELVEQRNSAPAKPRAAAQRSSAPQNAPARKPAQTKPSAVQPVVVEKKKGPRLGGVIFYTLYFMFILVFFVGTYFGLQWLNGWLADYEAAQPTVKCEEVFQQLFGDPDWGALYETAGVEDTAYEGKEEFVAYMEEKVGTTALTYMETSAGLSTDKKYIVSLDGEKIATFTLEGAGEHLTDIPDWKLGKVELFFQREESYYIENMDGHTVHVNGVALDDSFTIQIATTMAEDYLPIGTTGARMCTQLVTDLMAVPTVTVFDENGNEMPVSYNEETRTFTEQTEANTINEEQKEAALGAAKAYCQWMIAKGNRADIAKYFVASSDIYNTIIRTTELWVQKNNGYRFSDESVSEYCRYSEDLFSVRVALNLNVTRTDGTVRTFEYNQALFFSKQSTGKWLAYEMTNKDVSTPVGQVRLTFMDGNDQIYTDFYDTDTESLVTPLVSVPEGKVLSGWITITENEEGKTVYTVVFQPDEQGNVTIPEGTTLTPMTLYAWYENAPSAS